VLLNYNPPMTPYLSIVYQDDDLLIVNKPSGLLTVPGKDPKHADCLIARINLTALLLALITFFQRRKLFTALIWLPLALFV